MNSSARISFIRGGHLARELRRLRRSGSAHHRGHETLASRHSSRWRMGITGSQGPLSWPGYLIFGMLLVPSS